MSKKETVEKKVATKSSDKKTSGWINYISYEIMNGNSLIFLFGRTNKGSSFLIVVPGFKPYFFIKKEDEISSKKAMEEESKEEKEEIVFEIVDTDLVNLTGDKLSKVLFGTWSNLIKGNKAIRKSDILTYEADVKPEQRFCIDKNIYSYIDIDAVEDFKVTRELSNLSSFKDFKDFNVDDFYLVVYDNLKEISEDEIENNVAGSDIIVDPRILSLDIETYHKIGNDFLEDEIISISLYSDKVREVIITDRELNDPSQNIKKIIEATDVDGDRFSIIKVKDESELLEKFKERILSIDPDIFIGWNVVDFDLACLHRRFAEHKISFDIGRTNNPAKLRISNDFFTTSTADIKGRVIFDGMDLLRQGNIVLSDYKLDTAAKEILGDSKIDVENGKDGNGKVEEIIRLFEENKLKLAMYNLKDSKLVYDILEKKNLVGLMVEKSNTTGVILNRLKGSVAMLDSVYLREIKKKGIVANSVHYATEEDSLSGAFVMESVPGMYENVIVLDFKSLYPSIIRTYNIDPLAMSDDGEIIAPNGARFKNTDDEILPRIIAKIWKRRDEAKKNKDEARSYALKIIMNSFYGVLGNSMCRFSSLEMANAITSFSRETIIETINLIKNKGYSVIYGDTDSVFVDIKSNDIDEVKTRGKEIQDYVNAHFDKKVKDKYNRKSILELEFDKFYTKFMLPHARGSITGAKKRYAGLLLKGDNLKLDVTGMETVRSDWTDVSKVFQEELLMKVFRGEEFDKYIKDFVADLKKGRFDKQLMYKKSLRKPLSEYTKTTPPHVKAARMLDKITSTTIRYYQTVNGPEPVEKLHSKLDYDHYVEKQVKPIADTILVFFNKDFDSIIAKEKQKSLFDF